MSVITWCAEVDQAGVAADTLDPTVGHGEQLRIVLVGPFSAGKTSLIKRCLAEWGSPIPGSLAVGADPTTFESMSVESLVTLVDTPGTGNDRPQHTERALHEAVDADLLLLVLTPQLMSGSDPRVWSVLDSTAWRAEPAPVSSRSMRVVVNRFDESAASPRDDLAGYESLVELKMREMGDSIAARGPMLSTPRIHIIAADPGGLVFNDIPAGPEDYAGGAWDGVSSLLTDLVSARSDVAQLRKLRAVRVRGRDLLAAQAALAKQAPALQVAVSSAKKDRHDLQSHRAGLDRLRSQAATELDERLERAVGGDSRASTAPDREFLVRSRVTETIAGWAAKVASDIHQFVDGAPRGLTTPDSPLLGVSAMGNVSMESEGAPEGFWDALRVIQDNATELRETARVCREFLESSQRLQPAANLIGAEVVDLGMQVLSFALSVSGRDDQAKEELRRAEEVRIAFYAAARVAAKQSAAPLWEWIDQYAGVLETHDSALQAALQSAQGEQSGAATRKSRIEALLATMPAT